MQVILFEFEKCLGSGGIITSQKIGATNVGVERASIAKQELGG